MASEKFSSKLGTIVAAAGSAVGLGNIWRFPYILGADGGAAFLLLYLFFTLLIAVPVMMTEFVIGRRSGATVTSAFDVLAPGSKWGIIGICGVLTAFIIVSYYNIVSGWTLYYTFASATGGLSGLSEADIAKVFSDLSSDPIRCIIWMVVMLGLTAFVVAKGVSGGIEKYSKVLMPLLLLLVLVMCVRSLTLDGGMQGVKFYLQPDFSKLTAKAVFDALGQSFFSLSIGMGTMTTYGSYIQKTQNLSATAIKVAMIDFFIAFLAGIVIFPCVFAFGLNPSEGPGLVFVTLPNIFNQMPMGAVFSTAFFVLLVVAALTSSISLLEVVVSYFKFRLNSGRRKATAIASLFTLFFGIACAVFPVVFDTFDKISANVLMPLGAFFIVLFLSFRLGKDDVKQELEAHGAPFRLFNVFYFLVRYVIPPVILLIFINVTLAWFGINVIG